jgi:hypothetical protein
MPQRTGNEDLVKSLGEETDLERRKEEGRGFGDGAQRDGDGWGGGRASREGGRSLGPDVFLEVPKVQVDKVFLDDEGLDVHLLLQTRLADLVRVEAGVHVYFRKVKLDAKVVEAEALHKVRLENLGCQQCHQGRWSSHGAGGWRSD